MNKLIVASLKSQNLSRLLTFPVVLLEEFELEMVSWISNFFSKYGEPPSVTRLEDEFEDFIATELDEAFVLEDVADQMLKEKRISFFVSRMSSVIEKTRLEGAVLDSDVYSIMRSVTSLGGEESAYTHFDRSRYSDRRKTMSLRFFAGVLNRAMGDLHAGDYTLIIGRLGTGKSLVAQWQAARWLLDGLRILLVSQEMLSTEIFGRIDGMVSSFNPLLLRGDIDEDVLNKLKIAKKVATASGGEIFAPKGLRTPEQIAMAAKFFGVDAIIVDGVYQLMPDLLHSAGSARWERITEVSGQLKQVAQAVERPLVATTQIKRVGKSEAFTPEDIAFADALGQDADQIMAIEMDNAYPMRKTLSLIKNRYGPPMAQSIDIDFDRMELMEV